MCSIDRLMLRKHGTVIVNWLCWTNSSVGTISILGELNKISVRWFSAQPAPWKSEYVAELLFFCGRELLTNVLIAFAVGRNWSGWVKFGFAFRWRIITKSTPSWCIHCVLWVEKDGAKRVTSKEEYLGCSSTKIILWNYSTGNRRFLRTMYISGSKKFDYYSFTKCVSLYHEKCHCRPR